MTHRISISSAQSPLTLDAGTVASLIAQRDSAQRLKAEVRREWYESQLARRSAAGLEDAIVKRARSLLETITTHLQDATSNGESSVSYQAIFRYESVGWKYAQVSCNGVTSGPLDLSMMPVDHTVRIKATERVAETLARAGLCCELQRTPENCENCFLEELALKVTVPPRECS